MAYIASSGTGSHDSGTGTIAVTVNVLCNFLVACFSTASTSADITSVVLGSQSFTKITTIAKGGNTGMLSVWILENPLAGAANIVATGSNWGWSSEDKAVGQFSKIGSYEWFYSSSAQSGALGNGVTSRGKGSVMNVIATYDAYPTTPSPAMSDIRKSSGSYNRIWAQYREVMGGDSIAETVSASDDQMAWVLMGLYEKNASGDSVSRMDECGITI